MSDVKERPILFTGEMVRATLEGRKTKTRRIIKLREFHPCDNVPGSDWYFRSKTNGIWSDVTTSRLIEKYCPFGKPGDRLWVRETFNYVTIGGRDTDPWYERAEADGLLKISPEYGNVMMCYKADSISIGANWIPSIHMPRWASRILLEITNIRVERVQEISEDDVLREGVELDNEPCDHPRQSCADVGCTGKRANFFDLWESTYPGSWERNDWVWVIEFKVIDGGGE